MKRELPLLGTGALLSEQRSSPSALPCVPKRQAEPSRAGGGGGKGGGGPSPAPSTLHCSSAGFVRSGSLCKRGCGQRPPRQGTFSFPPVQPSA